MYILRIRVRVRFKESEGEIWLSIIVNDFFFAAVAAAAVPASLLVEIESTK
jgi:hypothetical protein